MLAVPLSSVDALFAESVAEPEVTANVTVAPEIGEPDALVTFTTNDCASAVPVMADCPLPLSAVTALGTTVATAVGDAVSPPQPVSALTTNTNAPTSVLPEREFKCVMDVGM